jgi:signal transduction histidine kinase
MNDTKKINMNTETLLTRIEHLENHRRFIHNALEMALSLGDFQENINKGYGPEHILQEGEKRISQLIDLDASVLYQVDQNQSDFKLSHCNAPALKKYVENEVEHMIDQGYFAWAIREKRGVFITSRDHTRKYLLHVIATYSRIRGMFVGLLPLENQKIPDTSLTLLSIILLNIANALESHEFYTLLRNQNTTLEKMVEERTEALARSERQLQQVLKIQAIGTLAGGIAHDFNNLLMGIQGRASLLALEIDPLNHQQVEHTEAIKEHVTSATGLTSQLLGFARGGKYDVKPVDINALLLTTAVMFGRTRKELKIRTKTDAAQPVVEADKNQIEQVLLNMLVNAWQAMPGGGDLSLETGVVDFEDVASESQGIAPGRYVKIMVTDTGLGMDQDTQQKVFDPFFTTKAKGRGTGMGLASAYGIVKNQIRKPLVQDNRI